MVEIVTVRNRYCICRHAYSVESTSSTEQNFLQCEFCAEWFHFECLGVTEEDVEAIQKFKCPRCKSLDDVLGTGVDQATAAAEMLTEESVVEPEEVLTDHDYYHACTAQVSQTHELELSETCLLCCGSGDVSSFIFCTQCGESFHTLCLNQQLPSRKKYSQISSRWRCLSCMRCSKCEDGTDDNLVVCDVCERGFHLQCIRPAITEIPKGSWICADCVQCLSCGSTVPGKGKSDKWHQDYTLCTPCSRLFSKKQYCPMCLKCYTMDTDEFMVGCDKCGMWVHTTCDGIDDESYRRLGLTGAKYFCITCREGKGSKRKDIVQFKKNMRWLSKRNQQRFRDEQTSKGKRNRKAGRQQSAEVGGIIKKESAKRTHDPPKVSGGTIDMLKSGTQKLGAFKKLPSEEELRTWTVESQREFWLQRRRFWDKAKLQCCQRACKAKHLWAGGDKQDIITRLALFEFHAASLQPQDFEGFDASTIVDIVIPDPVVYPHANDAKDANSGSIIGVVTGLKSDAHVQDSSPTSIKRPVPFETNMQVSQLPASQLFKHSFGANSVPLQQCGDMQRTDNPESVPLLPEVQLVSSQCTGSKSQRPSPKSLSTLQALLEMSTSMVPTSNAIPQNNSGQAVQTTTTVPTMATTVPEAKATEAVDSAGAAGYSAAPLSQPEIDSPQHSALQRGNEALKAKPCHITFQVQLLEGKMLKVKALESTVIGQVKQALQEPSGIEPNKQKLLHAGESLVESRTLASYKFTNDSVLSVDTVLSSSESEDEIDIGSDVSASEEEAENETGSGLRTCALCHIHGDRRDEGRLLPLGYDVWVHTSCAVWSAETYEDELGQLHNVSKAISRGQTIKCDLCKKPGATVGCCTSSCAASFHFKCAIRARCLMLVNKQVYCTKHKKKAAHNATARSMPTSKKLRDFEVKRKIYLPKPSMDSLDKQLNAYATGSRNSLGRHVGSFTLHRPGKVVFDCPAFHCEDTIYPADYLCVNCYSVQLMALLYFLTAHICYSVIPMVVGSAVRRFWSTTRVGERCAWRLEILRGRGGQFPVFRATCCDSGHAFFGVSPIAVWDQIAASVADISSGRGSGKTISAEAFFGLSKLCVREIIERLPGAGSCRSYRFRTIRRSEAHSARFNDSGCARSEVSCTRLQQHRC